MIKLRLLLLHEVKFISALSTISFNQNLKSFERIACWSLGIWICYCAFFALVLLSEFLRVKVRFYAEPWVIRNIPKCLVGSTQSKD